MKFETENEIVALCKKGIPPREIKKLIAVSGWTISMLKLKHGLPKSHSSGRPRNEQDSEITRLLKQGKTPREIKRVLVGVQSYTISYAARRAGIKKFNTGRLTMWPEERVKRIRELKHSGMTYRQIAEIEGVSCQRIQAAITKQPKPKTDVCPRCGKSKLLVRHHTNYLKDEVIYICGSCHQRLHLKERWK